MTNPDKSPLDRAGFFRSVFRSLSNLIDELCGEKLQQAAEHLEESFPVLIRPPGALPEEGFLHRCRRCGDCVRACPHFVLRLYFRPQSFFEKTPHFDPAEGFCRMCEGFPCIKACPSGALVMPPAGRYPIIGTVEISPDHCLNSAKPVPSERHPCNACVGVCPPHFAALVAPEAPDQPPVVRPEQCTGCGACISVCPVKPDQAIILKQKR